MKAKHKFGGERHRPLRTTVTKDAFTQRCSCGWFRWRPRYPK